MPGQDGQAGVTMDLALSLLGCSFSRRAPALFPQGILSEELFASLSRIPEVETFAHFWICKARLLAQKGPVDVAGLCEAAVRSGAGVSAAGQKPEALTLQKHLARVSWGTNAAGSSPQRAGCLSSAGPWMCSS